MVTIGALMYTLVHIIFAVIRDRKTFELIDSEEHAKMIDVKSRNSTA